LKIKNQIFDKGSKVKVPNIIEIENFDHPIFCFKHLHKDFDLERCNDEEKAALIEQIVRLSKLSWQHIQFTSRKGMGTEKISINSIKASIPAVVTEDITDLLALRFLGNAPFVGLRNRFVFHVIYIDRAFTLYNH